MAFRNIPPNGFPAIPDIEDLEGVEKDVSTLKTTTAGLAEDVSDLEEQKANQITIALTFNPESTYEVGDLVYYNGLTYRCTNEHTGEWDADDFAGTTIANELSELRSGLTKQVSNSITLPTTTNGITTAQIETSVPSGANIIGGRISNISSYSDAIAIGVYYNGNYARVTCVSPVETTLPSITLNLITTYTV